MSLFVIQCLHSKFKNKSNSPKIPEANEIPTMYQNRGDDNISVYDELDVQTMNLPDNHYQSLRESSRPTHKTEAETNEPSVYQNINNEKEENKKINP